MPLTTTPNLLAARPTAPPALPHVAPAGPRCPSLEAGLVVRRRSARPEPRCASWRCAARARRTTRAPRWT